MPIHFRCPHCEKLLAIGTAKGGTRIQCPLCNRLITVPPRTEVNLPTTTVMPPDLAQSWWMDAPSVAPPQATLPSEAPAAPPPADAWWLTTNAPSPAAENAITDSSPPSVPPPLPETIVSSPAAEAPPDLLVFEPFTKMPAVGQPSFHDHAPARNNALARFFTPLHIGLLVGAVLVSLLALTVLILLLRGSEPAPNVPPRNPPARRKRRISPRRPALRHPNRDANEPRTSCAARLPRFQKSH